ncbi:MAG: 23S rRNA (guanosine(2251)-2'-O)-methyltransferase RlmB [Pseudolabrys sp.]
MSSSRYVTGLRAVEQLLASKGAEVRRLFAEYQTANPRVEAVIGAARQAGIDVQAANRARLTQISGESRHQGVEAGAPLLLLLLDGVQDPHNLRACMRTADAAGVDAVITARRGSAGLGPTVSKVAAGAAEHLPFVAVSNLGKTLDWLGQYGICRVGTSDRASESIFDAEIEGPVALVMGREHTGLSQATTARCDRLVNLPMHGVVSSLNVSVATGICLFEILRRRA